MDMETYLKYTSWDIHVDVLIERFYSQSNNFAIFFQLIDDHISSHLVHHLVHYYLKGNTSILKEIQVLVKEICDF